jgi:hypothetical protein
MRYRAALLVSLFIWAPLSVAHAELFPFTAVLEIRASVGAEPASFELLSLQTTGTAEVDGGVVRIPSGVLSAVVPGLSGFGGALLNGPATFSAGGAGPGSTCPLARMQEICIDGGGFGGVMALAGVTHEGQALSVWGLGGTSVGSTASGLTRTEEGTRWTEGRASAWYYIFEIDGTPFRLREVGTFRGLPSTFTGTGLPGFSLVTPMVVTADSFVSLDNARAVAKLRIDFGPRPVPLGGAGVIAVLLALAGVMRLSLGRSHFKGLD